jgi:hypothetical protein
MRSAPATACVPDVKLRHSGSTHSEVCNARLCVFAYSYSLEVRYLRIGVMSCLCVAGGFWGHHWSNLMFTSDGSMVFGRGDHSVDFAQVSMRVYCC